MKTPSPSCWRRIGDLDELLEESNEANKPTPSPVVDASLTMNQQGIGSDKSPPPPVIVPLSWDDQCTKSDVKVIQPTISPGEQFRPVSNDSLKVANLLRVSRSLMTFVFRYLETQSYTLYLQQET